MAVLGLAAARAQAEESPGDAESQSLIGSWKRAHSAVLSFDTGSRASIYGAGYAHLWREDPVWFGAGARLLAYTRSHSALDAAGGVVSGKFGVFEGSPIGLELGFGGAHDSEQEALFGEAGGFISLMVVELGYMYGFPLPSMARPDWLTSHRFAVRIQLPFATSR